MRPGRTLAAHIPDLGRLLLCPTGGTNHPESIGSNDAPPPPRPPRVAGKHNRAAFNQDDIIRSILVRLAGGEPEDACRAAAAFCIGNTNHKRACAEGGWAELTEAVFPGARARPQDDLYTQELKKLRVRVATLKEKLLAASTDAAAQAQLQTALKEANVKVEAGPSENALAENWFIQLCNEHQHGRVVKKWRDAVAESELAESMADRHMDTDPGALNMVRKYEAEKLEVRRGRAKIDNMKWRVDYANRKYVIRDEYERYKAFVQNLQKASATENELSELTDRSFLVLVKSSTPEYNKTPWRNQFVPFTNKIQLLRHEIFEMRYQGKSMATDGVKFVELAHKLQQKLDQLERLMELSKQQGEAAFQRSLLEELDDLQELEDLDQMDEDNK